MSEATPVLVSTKIGPVHLGRDAYVYVRQSTLTQLREHTESLLRQYELRERAMALGWDAHQVRVIDTDLGRSGADTAAREGFKDLVADVGLGRVGIIFGIEVSRLARNNSDWYQLLDLCALTGWRTRGGGAVWVAQRGLAAETLNESSGCGLRTRLAQNSSSLVAGRVLFEMSNSPRSPS
jgi:Resolvase, N terminal domain